VVAPEIYASKILIGDRIGVACRFPSEWLWTECNFREQHQAASPKENDELPVDLEDIISQLLSTGLPISEINTPRLASMLGTKPRMIRARLRARGTSLSKVLDSVKRKQAIDLLGSEGMTVAKAAEIMGYADAANFTRAFRRLTGTTPKAFQKSRSIV
jgi:AraC-like DNA-binding protein